MTDREKLIDLLERATMLCEKICSKYDDCDMCPAGKDAFHCKHGIVADRLLASGVTFATDNNDGRKWIPVTERLPKVDKWVLTSMVVEEGQRVHRIMRILSGHCEGFSSQYPVTHWMPLPEDPKEMKKE